MHVLGGTSNGQHGWGVRCDCGENIGFFLDGKAIPWDELESLVYAHRSTQSKKIRRKYGYLGRNRKRRQRSLPSRRIRKIRRQIK